MNYYRSKGHTVSRLTVNIAWSSKYMFPFLVRDVKLSCRTLLIQIYESDDDQILKRVFSEDHIHRPIEYSPSQDISTLVKLMKGQTSRKL